ncbi:tetratricopeptide repeat protein [Nocardioides sp. LS1]|uniref:tetratricopeptide repeat protein n=1 Tax=Nocardioides sp. LS1 TaxID=1027620 RepID=UPI000F619B16|nr:tetratricopeptide repeat protein [Nocardioides sp. LS1]GCD91004.1 hypothetical protein NLS1_30100 [Nocardioides sp. LS1]
MHLLELRRYEAAEEEVRAVLGADPERADAVRLLAASRTLQHDWAQAQRLALRAVALDPQHPAGYRLASAAAGQLGRHERSLEAARQAVRLDPDDWVNHLVLGSALRAGRSPDLPHAESALREAIRLNPHAAEAYSTLGTVLSQRGRRKAAAAAHREAARLDPTSHRTANNLAAVAVRRERLGRAAGLLTRGLASDPQDELLRRNLDVLWVKLVSRMSLALLLLLLVQGVLLIPPTPDYGMAPSWWLRAGLAVAMLAIDALLAWLVVRRMPRGSVVMLRGLFRRVPLAQRGVLVVFTVLLVIGLAISFAPLSPARAVWAWGRPAVRILMFALLLLSLGSRVRDRARPHSYGTSARD